MAVAPEFLLATAKVAGALGVPEARQQVRPRLPGEHTRVGPPNHPFAVWLRLPHTPTKSWSRASSW